MKLKIVIIVVTLLSINFSSCADTGRLTKSSPPATTNTTSLFSSVKWFFEKSPDRKKSVQSMPLLPDMTTRRLSNTHLNDSQEYNPGKDSTDDTQSGEEKTNASPIPSLPMTTNNYPSSQSNFPTTSRANAQDIKTQFVDAFKQLDTTGSTSDLSTVLQLAKHLPKSEQNEVRKLYNKQVANRKNQRRVSKLLGIDYVPQPGH